MVRVNKFRLSYISKPKINVKSPLPHLKHIDIKKIYLKYRTVYTYYACLQTIASRRLPDLLWMAKSQLLDGEIPYLSVVQQFRHLLEVDA